MVATASPTAIANMALSHIGKGVIEDIDLEQSAEAKQCSLWYGFSRKQALKSHDWSFARKRITLATHTDAPPPEWEFRYQYPSDCVAIRRIPNPLGRRGTAIPFEVEISDNGSKSILTNLSGATAVYTFDQTTTTYFTPYFMEFLSVILAHHIAFALTGKPNLRADMYTIYKAMRQQAPAFDANEGMMDAPSDADWIRDRQADFADETTPYLFGPIR